MIKNQTLEAFIRWISAFPESYHYYDMQRFYDLARTATEQNDLRELLRLSWTTFFNEHQPLWHKKFRVTFEEEWKQVLSVIAGYQEFLDSIMITQKELGIELILHTKKG